MDSRLTDFWAERRGITGSQALLAPSGDPHRCCHGQNDLRRFLDRRRTKHRGALFHLDSPTRAMPPVPSVDPIAASAYNILMNGPNRFTSGTESLTSGRR